jgi:hypothetical protein
MRSFAATKDEVLPHDAARRIFGLISSEMALVEDEFERQASRPTIRFRSERLAIEM